ncbi:hypothetical protein [Pseudaestuariivita sp.]|uniref:hypothetical protein n=1 Tax=Pseudaestuariivita sp. TaxID=2211669 RepID=UPI0040586872
MKQTTPNDWILDVLADLNHFAQANGLRDLSEALIGTHRVAAREIASQTPPAAQRLGIHDADRNGHPGGPRARERA